MTMNELQSDLEQEQKAGEERVLRCRRCSSELADAEHEIPASRRAYMNPHGLVREIVALTDARNVVGDGRRHAEHSWFPGHTWEVLFCASCQHHVGWRFEGPEIFYGLLVEALA